MTSESNKDIEALYSAINDLIAVNDKLVQAIRYYRSPRLTKAQYFELLELNKYFDTNQILIESVCCNSDKS